MKMQEVMYRRTKRGFEVYNYKNNRWEISAESEVVVAKRKANIREAVKALNRIF